MQEAKRMDVPVYIQIHNAIRAAIVPGKWRVGDRIPSARDLAVTFCVSRKPLRQAIQTLVDVRILERRVGSGTYVANQCVQEKMSGEPSLLDQLQALRCVPSSKTVSYHVAQPTASEVEKLKLAPAAQVLRMERIRYADCDSISFETAAVPTALELRLLKMQKPASFTQLLEKMRGYVLGGAQQTVSAMLASERISATLAIKRGDAIYWLRLLSFLCDGTPLA